MQTIQWVMYRLGDYVTMLFDTPTPLQITGVFTVTWGGFLLWLTIMNYAVKFFIRTMDMNDQATVITKSITKR